MNDSTSTIIYDASGLSWGNITVTDPYSFTSSTASNISRIVINSGAGTRTSIDKPLVANQERRISPKLYFSFVKSKLKKTEVKALKVRLAKLQTLTKDAFDLQQQSLYEEYSKQMAIAVRESEAAVCGYDRWVTIQDIEKFKHLTKESGGKDSVVFLKKLDDFPRSIPYSTKLKMIEVKNKRVFDHLWVLYLDYTKTELKTNKEKIREKDPMLFGQFAYQKDRYYHILDWVDEYCDLTIDKFVYALSTEDAQYRMNRVEEIDEAFVERIKKEVLDRHERLTNTKPSNYHELMAEEDKKAPLKKPWYKRIFG